MLCAQGSGIAKGQTLQVATKKNVVSPLKAVPLEI